MLDKMLAGDYWTVNISAPPATAAAAADVAPNSSVSTQF